MASGRLPRAQLHSAKEILASAGPISRVLVACHYPAVVPAEYRRQYAGKPLINAIELANWLRTIGPHLYCCGHIHAAWAFYPESIPHQLCLNAGAPLMRDRSGHRPPGFLEIQLDRADVAVNHHGWTGAEWRVTRSSKLSTFFRGEKACEQGSSARNCAARPITATHRRLLFDDRSISPCERRHG